MQMTRIIYVMSTIRFQCMPNWIHRNFESWRYLRAFNRAFYFAKGVRLPPVITVAACKRMRRVWTIRNTTINKHTQNMTKSGIQTAQYMKTMLKNSQLGIEPAPDLYCVRMFRVNWGVFFIFNLCFIFNLNLSITKKKDNQTTAKKKNPLGNLLSKIVYILLYSCPTTLAAYGQW